MANITLLGASYANVPAVELPQTGGGTVTFYEAAQSGATIATATASGSSSYPTSLSFTVQGEPKAWMVINTGNITLSSGYYYISSVVGGDGLTTRGTYGYYKSGGGSSRYIYASSTHYTGSYSNGTFTVSSSASSRSAAGGAFYNTSYMLIYVY